MAMTPEELALDLSRASVRAQEESETQLRERAAAVLAAASIVVPVAAVATGHGPPSVVIPFGGAALAYGLCARECGTALLPHDAEAGLLGGVLLAKARASEADLRRMQATAADYLDREYRHNQTRLQLIAKRVRRAIVLLTVEILALALALFCTLIH